MNGLIFLHEIFRDDWLYCVTYFVIFFLHGLVKKGGVYKKRVVKKNLSQEGVRALARAQISYKTARVVRLTPSWSHRGADIVEFYIVLSTYRWTTLPSHLIIALLVWLQWRSKVAIFSENRENFEIFLSPSPVEFFSKKLFFQKNSFYCTFQKILSWFKQKKIHNYSKII